MTEAGRPKLILWQFILSLYRQTDYYEMFPKRCSKCEQEFPATTDYFGVDNHRSDGLTNQCKECRRKNTKRWREENPEKVKTYNRQYYRDNRDVMTARNRQWHARNKEKRRQSHRRWYLKNAEHSKAKRKQWYRNNKNYVRNYDRQRYLANPDHMRFQSRRWKANNPEKTILQEHLRLAREQGLPNDLTPNEWRYAKAYWDGKCAYCDEPFDNGLRKLTLDHYIPLANSSCPGTVATNCIPVCLSCNTSKGPKDVRDWLRDSFNEERTTEIIAHIQRYFDSLRQADDR